MEHILSVQKLSKYYGRLCALNDINLNISKGSIFGILGPNGSGKTTLLGVITDALKAQSGNYYWFKEGNPHSQKKIGALLETPNFYPYLSAEDNLLIDSKVKECSAKETDQILQEVGLYERKRMLFHTFSLGMKQRLAIASALLGQPEVVILDEPTNGLDPVGIAEIRALIMQISKSGKTVIIASHLLDEIQKVCTHVAILKQGKLLTTGSVEEVLSKEEIIEIDAENIYQLEEALKICHGIKTKEIIKDKIRLTLHKNYSSADLNKFCFEHGIILKEIKKQTNNLELKFLEITGQSNPR